MKRRDFIKLSMAAGTAVLLPDFSYAKELDISQITFSSGINTTNNAQTIIIFMYGGASQLGGNLSNIEEIKTASQSNYDNYFRGLTPTANKCWQEAGGTHMESLLANGDMTLFRCCYSKVREENNNKSHGSCTAQNQKGSFDEDSAGILANLAQILESNAVVNENTLMPFITLEGESKFYIEGQKPLSGYLKPVGLTEDLENPYSRDERDWRYYTPQERDIPDYNDEDKGFNAPLYAKMDTLAQKNNASGKIKDAFARRASLSTFIDDIASSTTPDLGADAYPTDNNFSEKLETAVKILSKNPDTKVVTIGTGGLGGWDDHNEARDYVERTESLFRTLKSAMAHIKAEGKEQNINIMVFGEFGRNVNLNSALGWDHGNLQNFYVLGGKGYFNHKGVVGETILDNTGSINRLYLKPKAGTYQFEPLSIAATIYKIYGIENPETLTNGNKAIDQLFT
ncbi:MAG TPA: DUF1501 domain-containing protein [Epsilonproteobacteria bacterium]|nr:DUF1501 domain-containing protein [Campylobacterota bacterium]